MNFNYGKTMALTLATLAANIAFSENICGQPQPSGAGSSVQKPADASQHVSRAHAFILETATENKLEIALGQLAQIRAENPQVRQFAQQLARDHALANQQLNTIAQQQRVPVDLMPFMELTQAAGPQFDQAYVRYLLQEGQSGLQQLREIAERHPDRSVQQFAHDQLTQMQTQLDQVQRVAGQLQVGGAIQEPAGAEPAGQGAARSGSSQEDYYSNVLQQRAEGRHYPESSGRIITEQAGAETSRELMQQVQRLEEQVQQLQQQLQQQVQQLQKQQGGTQSSAAMSGTAPGSSGSGMPMPQTADFVKVGAAYAKLCVAVSRVAMERAQRPEVRQLAETQLQGAQQASQRLAQLGQQYGVTMDAEPVQQLTQMSGPQFDQAYVSFVVAEHQRAIDDLRRAAEEQSIPAVQQFAKAQLPQMEGHLAHAQRLQNVIRTAGSIREPAGTQPQQYRDLRELLRP